MANDTLFLTVQVPAEEWDFNRRRLRYLQAVLYQLLRDEGRLREWFTARELVDLYLPGLPHTRQGLAVMAKRGCWRQREAMRDSRHTIEYHACSLPGRAFDGLLDRIVRAASDCPDELDMELEASPVIPVPPTRHTPPDPGTVATWVLPLMRLIRNRPDLPLADALAELPLHLPADADTPKSEEARAMLEAIGWRVCL